MTGINRIISSCVVQHKENISNTVLFRGPLHLYASHAGVLRLLDVNGQSTEVYDLYFLFIFLKEDFRFGLGENQITLNLTKFI